MTRIDLDPSKLLGFKLAASQRKLGVKPDMTGLGPKLGNKPLFAALGPKLGAKLGLKQAVTRE